MRHCRPMRSISFLRDSLSRLESGKERNKPIRRSRTTKASRKARSICAGLPTTAAGSETPQWAVIGCPGQTGQTSRAALSQTVKTKFIGGTPGLANSSQLLLLKLEVGRRAASSCFKACGLTRLAGKLPVMVAAELGFEEGFGHDRSGGIGG